MAVPFLVRRARRNNLCFGVSYHRFEASSGADPKPGMAVTPELFRRQIGILRELGPFISIDDAVSDKRPNGISFVLSFDDGYRDNMTILLPILEELKVPCCLYVTSALVSGGMPALEHDKRAGFCPPVLDLPELKILAAHPLITIGSHTHHHVRLSTLHADALEAELKTSRDWLRNEAGVITTHLAVPFGGWNDADWEELMPIAGELGFKTVASNFGGGNPVDGNQAPVHFRRSPAPATDDPDILTGWLMGFANRRVMAAFGRRNT